MIEFTMSSPQEATVAMSAFRSKLNRQVQLDGWSVVSDMSDTTPRTFVQGKVFGHEYIRPGRTEIFEVEEFGYFRVKDVEGRVVVLTQPHPDFIQLCGLPLAQRMIKQVVDAFRRLTTYEEEDSGGIAA